MEIEQSWAIFESFRRPQEPVGPTTIDFYHCVSCGGPKSFDVWDDLPVCISCGRVDAAFVSDEPEWRSGMDDGGPSADPCRVGAPVNAELFSENWGLSTLIKATRPGGTRLTKIHSHGPGAHRDRALFHAYSGFDSIGKGVLNLPDCVIYSAKIKYRAFNEAVLTRGAVRNGVKANCIFQACREHGVARTTREIADAFGIPARDLSRTTELYEEQVPEKTVHVTTAADLIPRFFNEITCLPEEHKGRIKMKVIKMCRTVSDCVDLMGRTPKAIACAVMHIAFTQLGVGPSKAEICKICDVSIPTLGKIENIIKESGLLNT